MSTYPGLQRIKECDLSLASFANLINMLYAAGLAVPLPPSTL
jgi:hypothetical protein